MVADINAKLGKAPQVWFISAGELGDGSAIAAIALQSPRTGRSVVLRGSKVLVNQDWFGRNSQDLFPTVEKLRAVMDDIPVGVIIIDDAVSARDLKPYHARMKAMVGAKGSEWEPVGSYPVKRENVVIPGALHVYVRHSLQYLQTAHPEINFARINALVSSNVVYARQR